MNTENTENTSQESDALDPDLIQTFVGNAHGNIVVVQELLEKEPRLLNAKWALFDENALEASGHMGNVAIANYLLEKGAPLTIFAAAMLGRTEDVADFLRSNPEFASADGVHGISILYHSALSGKVELVELLSANGGATNPSTAIHAAVGRGHKEMTDWLLERGADPNAPNYEGKSPLDIAVERGHDHLVEPLRKRGGTHTAPKPAAS